MQPAALHIEFAFQVHNLQRYATGEADVMSVNNVKCVLDVNGYAVGLHKWNAVDPELESAWFQPLNLQVKTWFQRLLFQIQLVPLQRAVLLARAYPAQQEGRVRPQHQVHAQGRRGTGGGNCNTPRATA
jgi:hypothetical protein